MRSLVFLFFLIITYSTVAQTTSLDDYKYVIVENQYDFQKEANQYRFNELVVFELEKRNFEAYRRSQILPEDINLGSCNALQLHIETSGFLRVYMILSFKNCKGDTIFLTKKGIGKSKSYDKAYFEALRDAMTSLDSINYSYKAPAKIEEKQLEKVKLTSDTVVPIQEDLPKFSENVNDTKAATGFDIEKDYTATTGDLYLIASSKGYNIFKGNTIIGSMKKSKGGCYLVKTNQFVGIGYETKNGLDIEFSSNGQDQIISFKK